MHGTLKPNTKRVRSGVTSGRRLWLTRMDSRTPEGARFSDLVQAYTMTLGGDAKIDEATRNHIRRIAFLQCVLEQREQEFVKTGHVSLEQTLEYQRTSNTQSRLMKRIGLFGAKPKTVDDDDDMSPLEYMKRGRKTTARERLHDNDEEED